MDITQSGFRSETKAFNLHVITGHSLQTECFNIVVGFYTNSGNVFIFGIIRPAIGCDTVNVPVRRFIFAIQNSGVCINIRASHKTVNVSIGISITGTDFDIFINEFFNTESNTVRIRVKTLGFGSIVQLRFVKHTLNPDSRVRIAIAG